VDKKNVLIESTFGGRTAEEEAGNLSSYFVETEQWRKVIRGDVDVVYGPKGSGKSALYSLLVENKEELRLKRRIILIAAENPRGTPAFKDVADDPPTSEEEFRGLWKLYFLVLLTQYAERAYSHVNQTSNDLNEVIKILSDNGLIPVNSSLAASLKGVLDYLKKRGKGLEGTVGIDPTTGMPTFTGKIILGEPTHEQQKLGFISVDQLIHKINKALKEMNVTVWLVLDRLDVAFADSSELENNALRSLFRVYLDLIAHSQISVKIFLRDDIWNNITKSGFREASHITKSLLISWSPSSLLNLIVRRLLYNQAIITAYGVNPAAVLQDMPAQSNFFYRVFPRQVDAGTGKSKTLDWMLSRTKDGSERTAPREVIHLLGCSRDQQLRLYEIGTASPPDETLFDRGAIKSALPQVSKARYEQTLCAEYPTLKVFLDKLHGEKTQQNLTSLQLLWKTDPDRTLEIAERLISVGFFARRGTKDAPVYWVPFLYRDALNLIQGAAEVDD
jgi:hypothetical protein